MVDCVPEPGAMEWVGGNGKTGDREAGHSRAGTEVKK